MERQLKGALKWLGVMLIALLVGLVTLQGSRAKIGTDGEVVSAAAGTCVVTFDGNGGTPSRNNKTVTVGGTYGDLPSATRSGYRFVGWFTSKGNAGRKVTSSTKVEAPMNHSIYAHWERLTCTVSLNLNGGSGSGQFFGSFTREQGSTYGSNLNRDPAPPSGKHFVGWYTAVSGGSKVTSSSVVPSKSSITLYAHYAYNTYTVKFSANGGAGSMSNKACTYGSTYTLPGNSFTRKGYSFAGWGTSAGGGVKYANKASFKNLTATNGGTVTLYAQWKRLNCTVSFDLNGGGTSLPSVSLPQGSAFGSALPSDPSAPIGKRFVGWFTSADGGTKYVSSSVVPYQSSLKLYAHWESVTYKVSFNGNGASGGSMSAMIYTYGSAHALPKNTFVREGYVFFGWNTKADGSGTWYADGAAVSNLSTGGTVTLYAMWKAAAYYRLSFDRNGGSGNAPVAQTVVSGTKVMIPKCTISREGHYFMGWSTARGGAVAYKSGDIITITEKTVLYAVWKPKTVILRFDRMNGKGNAPAKVVTTYGKTVVIGKSSMVREGYWFVGWRNEDGTKIYKSGEVIKLTADETTLYAVWKKK